MNMKIILLGMDSLTIAIYLLILVFSVGIVWRVEKELDISYKFFVGAALFLVFAEMLSFYVDQTAFVVALSKGFRTLGALFLLTSVLFMRDLIRNLDGEKKSKNR